MQTSKKMETVITELARKHGLDLEKVGEYIKLEIPGYQPLVVETVGPNMIAVGHFYIQEGDVMYDPEIVFQRGVPTYGWIGVEITQAPLGIWRRYAEIDDTGRIVKVSLKGVAELAMFANDWAGNIKAQGWLERGQLVKSVHSD